MISGAGDASAGADPVVTSWYDAHAERLADGYEGLDADAVHARLFARLAELPRLRVLDVGAGTGRDAAALAAMGHSVVAAEPSGGMLRLGRALHPDRPIEWSSDALPALALQRGPFDLVVLSAVWMHVPPAQREAALGRLVELSAPAGRIYLTLREGPSEPARGMHDVDVAGLERLVRWNGLVLEDLGSEPDLLDRPDVRWRSVILHRPREALPGN